MPHSILTHEEWQAIVEASHLRDVIAEPYKVMARQESKNQYYRIGISDYTLIDAG